jgi:hypothetical protein
MKGPPPLFLTVSSIHAILRWGEKPVGFAMTRHSWGKSALSESNPGFLPFA